MFLVTNMHVSSRLSCLTDQYCVQYKQRVYREPGGLHVRYLYAKGISRVHRDVDADGGLLGWESDRWWNIRRQ